MTDFKLGQEIYTMSLENLIMPGNEEVLKQNKARIKEKRKKEWGDYHKELGVS